MKTKKRNYKYKVEMWLNFSTQKKPRIIVVLVDGISVGADALFVMRGKKMIYPAEKIRIKGEGGIDKLQSIKKLAVILPT